MTCLEPFCGFTGFAFDDNQGGVWFEGTSYTAMVYQMLNQFSNSSYYLSEVERAQEEALGSNGYGITAACHNEVHTYFHDLFSSPHIAATASYICAKQGYNVLWVIRNGTNVAPIANTGEDRQAYINTQITLDGSSSWDYNNDTLVYNWSILAKPFEVPPN
jgi:hypothetical protein